MSFAQRFPYSRKSDLITPLVAALIIVLILFYIDEGYYDFRWMADWGNWFVFGIYLLVFFPIQWLISHFVLYKLTGWKKTAVMVGITVPATILFLWFVF